MNEPREQLTSLTSLRGVAALLVVLFHMGIGFYCVPVPSIDAVFHRGYLAVDFFFILSGFVLAHAYAERIAGGDLIAEVRNFAWARVCRIYPTHFAALALAYPLLPLQPLSERLLNVALLQVPWSTALSMNVVTWSVSAEIFAYALFPILVIGIWRLPVLHLIPVATAMFLVTLVASGGSWRHIIIGWPALARALPEFVIGICSYRFFTAYRGALRSDLVVALAVALLAASLVLQVSDPWVVLSFPALIIAVAANSGFVTTALTCRPLTWLGEISYSLYLVNIPALFASMLIGALAGPFIGALSAILLCILLGALLHRLVERPSRLALRGMQIGISRARGSGHH